MVSIEGVRGDAHELSERAARMYSMEDHDAKEMDAEQIMQRAVFPWVEQLNDGSGAQQVITAKEVAYHYGVPEQVFLTYIRKEIRESQAFWGLPFTLVLVISYIGMMISHHHAVTVYAVESGIVEQIEQRALFAYTSPAVGFKNIYNVSSYADFYSWLHKGLLPLAFGSIVADWERFKPERAHWSWIPSTTSTSRVNTTSTTTTSTSTTSNSTTTTTTFHAIDDPTLVLFFNRMVGGLRLSQERSQDDTDCRGTEALTRTYGRTCVGGAKYEVDPDPLGGRQTNHPEKITWLWAHDNVTHMRNRLYSMEKERWLDEHTQKVEIALPTYNGEFGLHSFITINFFFNRAGRVWKRIVPESVFAEQFPATNTWVYIFDFTWLACLVFIIVSEAREIQQIARDVGCGRAFFRAYIDPWNTVDWISLIYGITIIIITAMGANKIRYLNDSLEKIADLDGTWNSDTVEQFRQECTIYAEDLQWTTYLSNRARILYACYPWVIVLRLLKAFSAQPKLAVLTKTLAQGGQDLVHFMMVVSSIFAGFVVSGMVLFGGYMIEFTTVSRASVSCFRCMFGEMDWEAMVEIGQVEAFAWLLSFMSVMVLVFVNMFIVLILNAFAVVREGNSSSDTLWQEFHQGYHRWAGRRRGDLVPLEDVVFGVEGACAEMRIVYDPQHTEEPINAKLEPFVNNRGVIGLVTVDFLREHVMKMRTAQACELLLDAVENFYAKNKDYNHEDLMLQMAHEMKIAFKAMAKDLRRGARSDDSSGSDADGEDLEKRAASRVLKHQSREQDRRTVFEKELESCRVDLHHSRLWVGTQVIEGDRHDRGTISSLEDFLLRHRYGDPDGDHLEESADADELQEELTRHAQLELSIGQIQKQIGSAKQIARHALRKIEGLEPQLLEATEATAEAVGSFHELKLRVQESLHERSLNRHEAKENTEAVFDTVRGRHDCFMVVHTLSIENETLVKELVEARRERITAAKHRSRNDGFLEGSKRIWEPKLNTARRAEATAAKLKHAYYSRLLTLAERAAAAPGAGWCPALVRLLTQIDDINSARKLVRKPPPISSVSEVGGSDQASLSSLRHRLSESWENEEITESQIEEDSFADVEDVALLPRLCDVASTACSAEDWLLNRRRRLGDVASIDCFAEDWLLSRRRRLGDVASIDCFADDQELAIQYGRRLGDVSSI